MPAPFSPRPRRAGQLSAGSGQGELPLWAVLVVASGVLVLGFRGVGVQGSGNGFASDREADLASALPVTLDPPVAPVYPRSLGGLAQLVALEVNGDGSGRLMGRSGAGSTAGLVAGSGGADSQSSGDASQEDQGAESDRDSLGSQSLKQFLDRSDRREGDSGRHYEGNFRKGIREGLWSTWDADGVLRSRGHYVAGLRDGAWETFSARGALLTEVHYTADSKNGDWRAYSEGGALLEEGQYSENSQDGPWVKYYSDGQIKERGLFVNGLREGPWEFYDDIGIPTLESGEYRAGVKL